MNIRYYFSILFIGLLNLAYAQEGTMKWIALTNGTNHGGCASYSNCGSDVLCFGLEYAPKTSGILVSYTTGFYIDCLAGNNVVTTNASCVMSDNSKQTNGCSEAGLVLVNSSGSEGSIACTKNVPMIVHQVCFTIPEDGVATIQESPINQSTTIRFATGGAVTDLPAYSTFVLDRNEECARVLPVELLSFNATPKQKTVELDWETATEINNNYFEVTRSADSKNWETISTVKSAGNTTATHHYSEIDAQPLNGVSYYRLKQVDIDGTIAYSKIKTVDLTLDKTANIQIYPNPTSLSTITVEHDMGETMPYQLVSATGKVLRTGELDSPKVTIDIATLPSSVYFLKIGDEVHKILKTE